MASDRRLKGAIELIKPSIFQVQVQTFESNLVIKVGPDELEASTKKCELELEIPADGEPIAISGYPLAEPTLVTTSGHIACSWTIHNHQDHYLADVTANPGNSGGPVYRLQ